MCAPMFKFYSATARGDIQNAILYMT